MLRILICYWKPHRVRWKGGRGWLADDKRAAYEEGLVLERNGNGSASGDWSEEGPGLPENDEYSEASRESGEM